MKDAMILLGICGLALIGVGLLIVVSIPRSRR